jgi:hypothetical protein
MGKRINAIRKRISKPTYASDGSVLTDLFGFNSAENPYNNESTWFDLYKGEPLIRGAIDSKANAIAGDWLIESTTEIPTDVEKKRIREITDWLSDPEFALHTKLITIATKLQLTSLSYLEIERELKKFYILNSSDVTPKWNRRGTEIDHLEWKKDGQKEPDIIPKHLFVLGSRFDADTNLWMESVMETMIDIANLLYQSRKYNLDIFKSGGVPSMLFNLDPSTTDKEYKRFLKKIRETKAGKNLTARGIIKATVIGGFNKDMEYKEMNNYALQAIMTLLNISPVMMNLLNAKAGNDKQEANAFATSTHSYQNVINDMISLAIHKIYGKLEDIKSPKMNGDGKVVKNANGDIEYVFTKARPLSDPYRKFRFKLRKWVNPREQAALHKIYLDSTVFTPNEVRAQLGYEDREGGDEVLEVGMSMGNDGNDKPAQDRTEDADNNEDETQV